MARSSDQGRVSLLLLMAVACSGAASLMYQVAWTRRLIAVTTATATAQAVVLAVFMAGLGFGAFMAGEAASRLKKPLVAYAVVEALALGLATLSIPAISRSSDVRTWLVQSGTSPAAATWAQIGAISILFLTATVLLGASLPLVIEHAARARGRERADAEISFLYGFNTLGAVIGCLTAGFVTIERLGLLLTTLAGALLALVACAIALVLGRSEPGPREGPFVSAVPAKASFARDDVSLIAVSALAGLVGIGAEVLWTRLLALVVLNTTYAFTQVLAAVLLGIVLGGYLAGFAQRTISRSGADPRAANTRLAAAMMLAGAVGLALGPWAVVQAADSEWLRYTLARGASLAATLLLLIVVVIPAALVAAVLPLLAGALGKGAAGFGRLYAANTLGSVAGSTIAAFVLLPLLGTAGSLFVLEAVVLVAAAVLLSKIPDRRRLAIGGAGATLTALLLGASIDLPRDVLVQHLDPGTQILALHEGAESNTLVTEDAEGRRRLWINSAWVAGTGGGHRVLGHLPALFVEQPRRALGIALGTGQTFSAILEHGFEKLDCVELDRGVIDLSRRWFETANRGLFKRRGVVLHHDDGRAFMRAARSKYDLIVLEPLQAWTAGTSNLYSREFYKEARAALAPGGVVAQWIPFYGQGVEETRAMVRAGSDVFEHASLWLDDRDGILLLHTAPFQLAPAELARRIATRRIAPELARNAVSEPSDLLALFLLGPDGVRAWSKDAPELVDDRPFLEFAAARRIDRDDFPSIVRSVEPVLDDPARYLADTSTSAARAAAVARIVRAAMLRSAQIPEPDHQAHAISFETALAEAPESTLLVSRYKERILRWAMESRDPVPVYRRALEHAPKTPELVINLAIAYAKSGSVSAARDLLTEASTDPVVGDRARAALERLPKP